MAWRSLVVGRRCAMRHIFIALMLLGTIASIGGVACAPGGGNNPAPSGGPGY